MANIFDSIKKIPPTELENAGIIFRANKSGYICPYCGNGTGETGDGLSVKEFQWGFNYHCFKCEQNLTAVDLLAEYYGCPKSREGLSAVAEKAKEKFGLSFDDSFIPSSAKVDFDVVADEKDYSGFYSTVQSQLVEIGESFRGLSFEDLRAVGAGIATPSDFKKIGENIFTNCLILPFNSGHFFIRQLHDDPKAEYKPIKRGNTGSHKEIYNPYGANFEKPVFVVEGIIDCLSIHAAGFPAVAIDGLKWEVILPKLKKCKSSGIVPKIIIMFDNDKAGVKAAAEAVDGLKRAGYIMAVKYFLDTGEEKIDANNLLQKDKAILATRLTQIYDLAGKEFEKKKAEIIPSTADNAIVCLSDVFDELDSDTEKIKDNQLKTGFPSIDEKLPLLPGIYLLGGLPSMGKTTFAMNIAANICEQGVSVLYVNFEQKATRLAYKDLARYWYLKNRKEHLSADYTPTATQIMLEEYFSNSKFTVEQMKKVREELKERRKNFFYLQGTIETAENLVAKIAPYVSNGVKFVVIDYIQLILNSDERANKREGLDATIRALQKFQMKNDIVLLFVSSFNRQNYKEYVTFESFKESGGLEYTADAILGLQFKLDNEKDRGNNAKFQQMKMEKPRKIQLVCIKQRYGENFECVLDYHSAHDAFIDRTADGDFDDL